MPASECSSGGTVPLVPSGLCISSPSHGERAPLAPPQSVFPGLTILQGSSGQIQFMLIFISPTCYSSPYKLLLWLCFLVFHCNSFGCLSYFIFSWWQGRTFYNKMLSSIDYMITVLAVFCLNKNLNYRVS